MKKTKYIIVSYLLSLTAIFFLISRWFYPYHRWIAIILYAGSLVPFIIVVYNRIKEGNKSKILMQRWLKEYVPHFFLTIILLFFAYLAWVLIPVQKTSLVAMNQAKLEEDISQDWQNLNVMEARIPTYLSWLEEKNFFSQAPQELSSKEKEEIKEVWFHFIIQYLELERLKNKYRGFYNIDYLTKPKTHAKAFLIAFTAFVLQYKLTLEVVNQVKAPLLERYLNDKDLRHAIPKDSYFKAKQRLNRPSEILRLQLGLLYLGLVEENLKSEERKLVALKNRAKEILKGLGKKADLFINNPLEYYEKMANKIWLPAWQKIAGQISKIRNTKHKYSISYKELKDISARLEPGDILLERRKWHLTNVGIPGFWPHSALYVGTPDRINNYFKELKLKKEPVEYLRKKYPEVITKLNKKDSNGFSYAVIEVKKPGVILNSVEESLHADYIAVLRPQISKQEKFEAITKAFSYYQKSYDYDFDFTTDSTLVCSELVFKAYQDISKLKLKAKISNGRQMFLPNDFAKKYAQEYGEKKSQLKLVIFWSGDSKNNTVYKKGEQDFCETWEKRSWDMLLK